MLHQRYRLLHTLGQGGMSAVYVAHDTQLGDRLVAVKEMGVHRLSQQNIPLSEAVQQFQHEAHLLASLHHPSLPVIYEYFQEDARWYLVMSFIEGQTLQAALEAAPGKKLPVHDVVRIGIELCKVLDYLHTHDPQIVFRDLKPLNIMLTPKGQIYLIDFGIARHFKRGKSTDTRHYSSTGYSPLEQYGRAQTSPRSDIYSLGVTLHQMLSGLNPSANPFQLANLHIVDPTLPLPLVQLITQMLEMQEQNRPVSAKAVQAQLENVFKPVLSMPISLVPMPPIQPSIPIQPPLPVQSSMPIQPPLPIQSSVRIAVSPPSPIPSLTLTVRPEAMEMLHTLTEHTGSVLSVAWSTDGQLLASGSEDKTIKVWDVQTLKLSRTLTGHRSGIGAVAWHADGQTLASGSWDKTIKIWNAKTGQQLCTLTGHEDLVWCVAWHTDGQTLASGCLDHTIKIWNVQTGQLLRTLTGHTGGIGTVVWSTDGQTLASSSSDKTIKVWNARTGQVLRTLTDNTSIAQCVAWSPDGQTLASGSLDQTIKVWNVQTGQLLRTLVGHTNIARSLAWSKDGQTLASGSLDQTVKVWNTQTGQVLRTLTGHTGIVQCVAWGADGQTLASGSQDSTIKVWG